jgi:hypothetical protein
MYTLLALTVLAQPAPAPGAGATQPTQVVARIDKGNLLITSVANLGGSDYAGCYGFPGVVVPADPAALPGKAPAKAPVKVKVSRVVLTTVELPAKEVEAYTTDGKTVSAEKLAEMLAKERTVLIAPDGKKVDPFYLQLYKEGTIVLVPPANTLHPLQGGYGGPAYGSPAYGPPIRAPREELPAPLDRKPPDNTP